MECITKSASETQKFAREFADTVRGRIKEKESRIKGGRVIALTGDLGSGKTTFMQGFAEGLGFAGRLISPTFILMRQYPIDSGKLYHLDVYRLEKNASEEAKDLGLLEIMSDPANIVVIEWAEKIKDMLPKNKQWITFEYVDEDTRKIQF